MASILKVDTITGVATAGSIAITGEGNSTTTNLQQGLAKAWVNFNGEGTVAIRDSHNTASLSDDGVGVYSYNITSNMATGDYCRLVAAGDSGNRHCSDTGAAVSNLTSKGIVIQQAISDATLADGDDNNGAMLGDLA